jgi:hypothetical protein
LYIDAIAVDAKNRPADRSPWNPRGSGNTAEHNLDSHTLLPWQWGAEIQHNLTVSTQVGGNVGSLQNTIRSGTLDPNAIHERARIKTCGIIKPQNNFPRTGI